MMINHGELDAFVSGNHRRFYDDFYNDDISMSLMEKKTYPGGKYIVEGDLKYFPCYYVQSVVLFDADVADYQDGDPLLWSMVHDKLKIGIEKLRHHIKRSMFRPVGSLVYPEFDDDDELLDFFPIAATDTPAKVRQLTSFEEIMWCESFESLQFSRESDVFQRLPHRTDKLESTKFDRRLWKEHLDGITPIGVYNLPNDPAPPYDRKYAITSREMFRSLFDEYYSENNRFDTSLREAEYDHIVIDGVPILPERLIYVPAENCHPIYTLDYQWLKLRPHCHFDVKLTSWQRAPNAVASYTVIVWFGNLTFQSLDSQGLLLGLDPALGG